MSTKVDRIATIDEPRNMNFPLIVALSLMLGLPALAETWFVDPEEGKDHNLGNSSGQAWKSLARVNALKLGAGDEVIVAPGQHAVSLIPKARGTAEEPVVIRFLPGVHVFPESQAIRKRYHISNSCATPEVPMPIGIFVEKCEHLLIKGGGFSGPEKTTLMMDGRMVHFINDQSEAIRYEHLVFDLKRPTVSEFRVIESQPGSSVIQIAEGSTYTLKNGQFEWTGDIGDRSSQTMTQEAIPSEGRAWRVSTKWTPFSEASSIEELEENQLRLHFKKKDFQLKVGHQFQFRQLLRDVVGAHNNRSKNISIEDCEFNALAGMGIISQFTDGLTFKRVRVVPPEDTIRTCPAWADVFHFSGCRGQITVEDCVFSGTQDDPVNVHGTHLGIIGKTAENRMLVRFMHDQTYGFAAFQAGDEVAVISGQTLRESAGAVRRKVTKIRKINAKDWEIELDGKVPDFEKGDVVDNVSWYPDVTIRGCKIDMDSCRGFLLTTRGKVVVENNLFYRCRMPAILIEGDADGWHESGPIRDMVIQNNTFVGCGIHINPRVRSGDLPVHENIRIVGNTFKEGAGISAHHAAGLQIKGNTSDDGEIPLKIAPNCVDTLIEGNQ
ncbi:MAG: right-handed parallel beta-helix repeat-containing protein [Akkermansiaceae bacterium]